jgi:DNA-binding LacI/PurR family transcriptional regulator
VKQRILASVAHSQEKKRRLSVQNYCTAGSLPTASPLMKPLQRVSMADRLVTHLKGEITSGSIADEMPSCRDLARKLGVSPPTVLAALAKLASDGWLSSSGGNRPYQIVQHRRAVADQRHRLLLLSAEPISSCNSYTRAAVERLTLECAEEGWEIQTRTLDFQNAKAPTHRWDELVRIHRPTHLMAITGTPVVARWAQALALPTFFIGGSPGDTGVPTVGVSLSASMRQLLRQLPADECLHFSLPICGYPEVFATAIHQACREELEARGIAFVPNYHAPCRLGSGPGEVRAALRPVMAQRVPNLLVFTKINDYLAVEGMLAANSQPSGRPKLAFLTHDELLDWMEPRPATFIYPFAKLWQLVKMWLTHPDAPQFNRGNLRLKPIFRPGRSHDE